MKIGSKLATSRKKKERITESQRDRETGRQRDRETVREIEPLILISQ